MKLDFNFLVLRFLAMLHLHLLFVLGAKYSICLWPKALLYDFAL